MLKRIVGLGFFMGYAFLAFSQKVDLANKYAETVTVKDLRSRLEIIASDEFEGRETGQPGQKKAAEYIREQFKSFGYQPIDKLKGFYQPFNLQLTYPDTVKLTIGEEEFKFLKDMYYFPGFGNMVLEADDILYLGFGIEDEKYSDYVGRDVKDRVLMISGGEPVKRKTSRLTNSSDRSNWTVDWTKKIELAKEKGAKALIIIDDNLNSSVSQYGRYIKRPNLELGQKATEPDGIPLIYISSAKANRILVQANLALSHQKLEKKMGKMGTSIYADMKLPVKIEVNKVREELISENVLAYLEGTEKPDELVVVTAHYDHLGRKGDKIFNGADDDGSGTTTLIELAQAFAQAKKDGNGPKRSMLFMTVSGEEKGLLGSEYYADNPVFPLKNTVANLNIDMIGRIDKNHAPDSNYVYLIGSDKLSTELHALSEEMNKKHGGLELDYTYNDENDPNRFYYRSDHYNFAKNNIPVIFYFTGVHDDYHQPTDTVDKIMFQKMEKIARLVFHTAWEIANRPGRLKVDVPQKK